MTVFTITLGRMISLFLIVIVGYIVRKCGLVKDEWVGGLMKLFTDWRIYVLIVFKQIIFPVLVFFVARPFSPEPIFLSVLVLFAAMPMPAPPLSLISIYGGNLLWSTRTVVMTTLLSVITTPFIAFLFL